jgi:hypothetical protein
LLLNEFASLVVRQLARSAAGLGLGTIQVRSLFACFWLPRDISVDELSLFISYLLGLVESCGCWQCTGAAVCLHPGLGPPLTQLPHLA